MATPDPVNLAPLPTRSGMFDPRALLLVYLLGTLLILLATRPGQLLPLFLATLLGVVRVRCWAAWWQIMRLLALVTASVLLFSITPVEELGESLLNAGLSPRLVFLLEGTLRFVPAMATLLREVREAQESRGIRLDGVYLLRNGAALLAPLLVDVMRFADDLAEALEARGFGGQQRTPLIEYRFQWHDWALVTTAALLTVALVRVFLFA